jgi:hypothetical protein
MLRLGTVHTQLLQDQEFPVVVSRIVKVTVFVPDVNSEKSYSCPGV